MTMISILILELIIVPAMHWVGKHIYKLVGLPFNYVACDISRFKHVRFWLIDLTLGTGVFWLVCWCLSLAKGMSFVEMYVLYAAIIFFESLVDSLLYARENFYK